ncbi:MAG: hypothetical protein RMA76_26805 [Deltaproteobacteria bacterium]
MRARVFGLATDDLTLTAWLERLAAARVTMAGAEAVASEFAGWLELLERATEGDSSAEGDLYRLCAMHGRRLGQEGRPASAAILQPLLLADVLGPDHRFAGRVRELVKIIADAHALGTTERLETRQNKMLRTSTPVLRVPGAVVGWIVGPMLADTIDAIAGRLFAECAAAGASKAILDLSTAQAPNDVFFRTIAGYTKSDIAPKYRLVLTGVEDIDATRAAIAALGADVSRFEIHARLYDVLPTE